MQIFLATKTAVFIRNVVGKQRRGWILFSWDLLDWTKSSRLRSTSTGFSNFKPVTFP